MPFQFTDYHTVPTSMTAVNNHHTLSTTATYVTKPRISGGGLPYTYEFVNFHFHWGADESQGSEHTIDTVQYPLELHIVHSRVDETMDVALTQPHGLAVLGIFFELSMSDNPALEHVLSSIDVINAAPDLTAQVVNPYALASLLPDDVRRFYRYDGSLTTPVCNEAVVWTVFAQPLHVSRAQLDKLRSLADGHGGQLQNNFRNPQPLNGRTVSL
ncbi:carbonic anhydrase alpha, 12-like, partial [Hyalella azteca]